MFLKPRFVQIITSVSVAAVITIAPVTSTFDAAGRWTLSSAMANADPYGFSTDLIEPPTDQVNPPTDSVEPPTDQVNPPTDSVEPPTGPVNPPTDSVELPAGPINPPTESIDPPTDPVNPPTESVDPPTGPVNPPTETVDPPTDPVTPPTGPVELPDGGCEKDSKCVEAKGNASTSNDDDDVPPIVVVDTVSAKEEGLAFVKTLRCQTACTASVAPDGDVTVTLTSTTTGGDSVETKITQDGDQVATRVVLGSAGDDEIIFTAEESFESKDKARDVVEDRTQEVPENFVVKVSVTLNSGFTDQGDEPEHSRTEIAADFMEALADQLDIPISRLSLRQLSEG